MSRDERGWHQNFDHYTKFIVNHTNYKGIPYETGADGKIKWVVTGKSAEGQKRRAWWDRKCAQHGIDIKAGCYAKIAPKDMSAEKICFFLL